MTVRNLVDLDSFTMEEIDTWLELARAIENGRHDISGAMDGKILCPIFAQESSRTYINAITSFLRMGGTVLPLNHSSTRFGSRWNEPIQDFACLINSCCDHIICRDSAMQSVRDLASQAKVPFINAGNGVGIGAEHPMQALIDLYTIRSTFTKMKPNILMIGGLHIRTTRSQIKLFLKAGYDVSVMSPPSQVDNSDIDALVSEKCRVISATEFSSWADIDIIYHNGIDEDPDASSPQDYILNLGILDDHHFKGKVMHSLPRKNELSSEIDNTDFNLYFRQMENSKWVFQSIYWHQHFGKGGRTHGA